MYIQFSSRNTLLIRNCKLFAGSEPVIRDIYIQDGIIREIRKDIRRGAEKDLNADQNIILPGLIDSHVHLRCPGEEYKEDWTTGSRAALAGGITTVLDMPNNKPPVTTCAALEGKRQLAAKSSMVNYGFHFGATSGNLDEIRKARNVASVKIYFGASTGDLLVSDAAALERIVAGSGKLACVHAELDSIISGNSKRLASKRTPDIHGLVRSREAEIEAIAKLITIAERLKKPIYICHVSTKEGIALIRNAKRRGVQVFCEVTPQHIFLNDSMMKKLGNFGKVNPPLRTQEDQDAIQSELQDGIVDVIATDHAPHTTEEKKKPYWDAPSGMPGMETMLPLLFDSINRQRFALGSIIRLMTRNPAKIFGIRNKGVIREGYDADLVIVDSQLEKEVKDSELMTKCGWSPFSGKLLKGWPVTTIVGGKIAYHKGKFDEDIRGREIQFERRG